MSASNIDFKAVMKDVRRQYPGLVLASCFVNMLLLVTAIYMLQIYDRVLSSGSYDTLIWLTVIALFVIVVYGILEQSRRLILSRSAGFIDDTLNTPVLRHAISHKIGGRQPDAAIRDVTDLRSFYQSDAALSFLDAPWSLVFIFFVWLLHPLLGALALVGALVLLLSTITNDLLIRERQKAAAGKARSSHETALRIIDGAETISPLGMTEPILSKWREAHNTARAEQQELAETTTTILNFTRALRLALQVGLLGLGAYLVLQGKLTPGAMIAASIIGGRALSPIERLTAGWKRFVAARAAEVRLTALFCGTDQTDAAIELPRPEGALSVETVSYLPEGAKAPILRNVAFSLEPGESCAIVGPSGAGKSTLCRLLVGATKPSAGNVRLDGADVFDWDADKLGGHIGYLPQKVELFPGTVAENIARFGNVESDEVIRAARDAGVHELILRLPDGYETRIGQDAHGLSLGQAQRIGLARALLRRPPLVVLDEPNSNLDQEGDRALIQALETMSETGSTVIVVSHRAGVLKMARKVAILADGQLARFGDCEDILRPADQNSTVGSQKPSIPAAGGSQTHPTLKTLKET